MKHLLILIFTCLHAHSLYGMKVKQRHAEQKTAAAQIASQEISFPRVWHLKIRERSIAMSKGYRVLLAEGYSVMVHDFEGNVVCSHFLEKELMNGAILARTISDDGRFVALANTKGKIGVIDVNSKQKNSLKFSGEVLQVYQLAFDHQGKNLAILGLENSPDNSGSRAYLALLDENLQQIKKIYLHSDYKTQDDSCAYGLTAQISVSTDGKHVAAITPYGLFFWDIEKNELQKELNQNDMYDKHISIAACDNNTFATLTRLVKLDPNDAHTKLIGSIYQSTGQLVKKTDVIKLNERESRRLNVWDARLKLTLDGLRIFFPGQNTYAIADFETGKLLHEYDGQYSELCCAGYNGVIKYKHDPLFSMKKHEATIYESEAQARARHKAYAPAKAAALRKKRIITAVACVAGAVAAYVAWKKFKKKKKPVQIIGALSKSLNSKV